ncbi:Antigen Peptide Transporter 2 [Manis pentadactyla]|nr:Antigen Peptide Transporter 2 [Manis pentadactyla]
MFTPSFPAPQLSRRGENSRYEKQSEAVKGIGPKLCSEPKTLAIDHSTFSQYLDTAALSWRQWAADGPPGLQAAEHWP